MNEAEEGHHSDAALDAVHPEFWDAFDDDPHALADLVNRVLDKGVVITGEVTISIAGVDLVYLGVNAILTSVATARRNIGPVGRLASEEG